MNRDLLQALIEAVLLTARSPVTADAISLATESRGRGGGDRRSRSPIWRRRGRSADRGVRLERSARRLAVRHTGPARPLSSDLSRHREPAEAVPGGARGPGHRRPPPTGHPSRDQLHPWGQLLGRDPDAPRPAIGPSGGSQEGRRQTVPLSHHRRSFCSISVSRRPKISPIPRIWSSPTSPPTHEGPVCSRRYSWLWTAVVALHGRSHRAACRRPAPTWVALDLATAGPTSLVAGETAQIDIGTAEARAFLGERLVLRRAQPIHR